MTLAERVREAMELAKQGQYTVELKRARCYVCQCENSLEEGYFVTPRGEKAIPICAACWILVVKR